MILMHFLQGILKMSGLFFKLHGIIKNQIRLPYDSLIKTFSNIKHLLILICISGDIKLNGAKHDLP